MKKNVFWLLSLGLVGCVDLEKEPSSWSQIEEPTPSLPVNEPVYTPNTPPNAPQEASCTGVALLEVRADSLLKVFPDGSTQTLLSFGEGAQIYVQSWESFGDNQVLVLSTYLDGEARTRVIRITSAGIEVLAELEAHPRGVHLGEDGFSIDDGSGNSIVIEAGVRQTIPGYVSSGPIDGHVLVRDRFDEWDPQVKFKWLNVSTGAERAIPAPSTYSLKHVSGGVFFQTLDNGLVISRPNEDVRLGSPTQGEDYIYGAETSPNREWLHFQNEGGGYTLVDVKFEQIHRFALEDFNGNWSRELFVADDGELTINVTADGMSHAEVSSDFGETWKPVGAAMNAEHEGFMHSLVPQKHGENMVLTNIWVGYGYYLNEIQFVRDGEVLDQIPAYEFYTGGAYGISDALSISDDGGCVVFWRHTEPVSSPFSPEASYELIMFDFASGEASVLRSGTMFHQHTKHLKFIPR